MPKPNLNSNLLGMQCTCINLLGKFLEITKSPPPPKFTTDLLASTSNIIIIRCLNGLEYSYVLVKPHHE